MKKNYILTCLLAFMIIAAAKAKTAVCYTKDGTEHCFVVMKDIDCKNYTPPAGIKITLCEAGLGIWVETKKDPLVITVGLELAANQGTGIIIPNGNQRLLYDISVPTNPVFVGSENTSASNRIAVADNNEPVTVENNGVVYTYSKNGTELTLISTANVKKSLVTSVFPNPFSLKTTFELSPETIQKNFSTSISIYDITGREVANIANISSSLVSFESGKLENGIYYYKVISNNKEVSAGKLMIAK